MAKFVHCYMINFLMIILTSLWILRHTHDHFPSNIRGDNLRIFTNMKDVYVCNVDFSNLLTFGSFYGVPLYYTKKGYNTSSNSVNDTILSIATMCDVKRLLSAQQMAINFMGPISISIYIESIEKEIQSKSLCYKIKQYFDSIDNKYDIYISLLYPDYSSQYYQYLNLTHIDVPFYAKIPINPMRNLAVSQVKTKYVTVLDVDFLHMSDSLSIINQSSLSLYTRNKETTGETIWIIPSFEWVTLESQQIYNNKHILNKNELLNLIDTKQIIPFLSTTFIPAQQCTDYNQWYYASHNYEIKYCSKHYEPFLILNTNYANGEYQWNNAIIGRWYDKSSHIAAMAHKCIHSFEILSDAFIIHEFTHKKTYPLTSYEVLFENKHNEKLQYYCHDDPICWTHNICKEYIFKIKNKNFRINNDSVKIFEISTKRTGTKSLGIALEILGYNHIGFDADLWSERNVTNIVDASKHFNAFSDVPWRAIDFRIWLAKYPKAKFILLERDESSWIRSVELNNQIYSTIKEELQWKYEQYETTKQFFKNISASDQLLVMNISNGEFNWKNLCSFLNKPIPSQPFPGDKHFTVNVYEMELPYYIIQKNDTIHHCINLVGEGLGNMLAQYWLSIAFAFFNKFNWNLINNTHDIEQFEHIICPSTKNNQALKYFYSSKFWTYFLPRKLNFHHNPNFYIFEMNDEEMFIEMRDSMNEFIYTSMRTTQQRHDENKKEIVQTFTYPFWQKILIFVMNKLFLNNVYIPAVENAFSSFKYSSLPSFSNDNTIVIHLRCGDLLGNHQVAQGYGFFGISVVTQSLKHWNVFKNSNKYSIYLLTNGVQKSNRKIDAPYAKKCELLVQNISNFLIQDSVYSKFKSIQVINNGTINDDMYRIVTAKYVICGYSTFCYYSAFANQYSNVAFIHKIDDVRFSTISNLLPVNYLPIKQKRNVNYLWTMERSNTGTDDIYQFFISH